jgi:hypothetical protein
VNPKQTLKMLATDIGFFVLPARAHPASHRTLTVHVGDIRAEPMNPRLGATVSEAHTWRPRGRQVGEQNQLAAKALRFQR